MKKTMLVLNNRKIPIRKDLLNKSIELFFKVYDIDNIMKWIIPNEKLKNLKELSDLERQNQNNKKENEELLKNKLLQMFLNGEIEIKIDQLVGKYNKKIMVHVLKKDYQLLTEKVKEINKIFKNSNISKNKEIIKSM